MKNYRQIAPIVMIAIMFIAFYSLFSSKMEVKKNYNTYIENARAAAEQGIIVDAAENYAKALEINKSIDIYLEVGNMYIENYQYSEALTWGDIITSEFPKDVKGYEFKAQIFYDNKDFNSCYVLNNEVTKRKLKSDKISEIMEKVKYEFYFEDVYEDVGGYSQGFYPIYEEEKWGLASEKGKKVLKPAFATIGKFGNNLAPVTTMEGEIYFIDSEGNKRIDISELGEIKAIKGFSSGYFSAKVGDKWSYYDKEKNKLGQEYDDCTSFGSCLDNSSKKEKYNLLAAVKNNEYWQLINGNFEIIANGNYLSVVMDENDIAFRNNRLFVNDGGKYYLLDEKGNKVTETSFLDAKTFCDDTYAAVKTDKGWTFVDKDGKEIAFSKTYEDTNSFSEGLAGVKEKGKWGFIDIEGNVAIDYQFEDVKEFKNGCVFVKQDDVWKMLKLYSKNYSK